MTSADKFGATALLTPGHYTSDAPGSGTALAHAMRSAYTHAQRRGNMIGSQTYVELPFDLSAPTRTVSGTTLQLVARHYVRLPPYANRVYYQARYRVFGSEVSERALVAHQVIVTDESANAAEGVVVYDDRSVLPLSWQIDIGTDSQQSDPGETGVFNLYDLPYEESLVSADIAGLLVMTELLRVDLYAYAVVASDATITAESSSLTSNVVNAIVPTGHPFVVGQYIWTSGFDIDVPRGSPTEISAADADEIEWTVNAADDADFGTGTIHSALGGYPLPYRPSPGGCWWEI
jgi:hypothetical protein